MTRTEKIAVSILRPINPSLIIVLAIYTIFWGLWLANPFTHVFGAAAIYSAMSALLPEVVWGGIAIASGLLIMRGALKPSFSNLQIGAFVGFFHWFIIGILYLMGDWINTGGITALTFAIYSAIIWVNIKLNRSHYESLSE